MRKIKTPFFMVNPKSYLYGKKLLKLALAADAIAKEKDFDVFFTAPFVDLRMIAENTTNLIVTAQHMDSLKAGRGMGYVVPEALAEAGVKAVFLNHAEHSLKLEELVKVINRAKENDMYTVVCADSVKEAQAIATLKPDILLCEPTELIGTGTVSDKSYIEDTNNAIRSIDADILVMQAAGISTGKDVYETIISGADGTGCTSGIVCAKDPEAMVKEMLDAIEKAVKEKG